MKKLISVVVILLFIGLAFAPSINANVGKEELVEFTTEVCGLNGGKQKVKLTQQQAEEVEALFASIREKLNTTDSRQEAEEIFKDAVIKLDKYGLLGGLSVKQVQRLVTANLNSRVVKIFKTMFGETRGTINSNYCCLVAGEASNIYLLRPLFPLYKFIIRYGLGGPLYYILILIYISFPDIYSKYPLKFLSQISFGKDVWAPGGPTRHYPAKGWVYSVSSKKIIEWYGKSFWGEIHTYETSIAPVFYYYHVGIIGFTGINIYHSHSDENYFLGTALFLKIDVND